MLECLAGDGDSRAPRVPDEVLRQIVELILIELDQEAAALVVDARMLHYAR